MKGTIQKASWMRQASRGSLKTQQTLGRGEKICPASLCPVLHSLQKAPSPVVWLKKRGGVGVLKQEKDCYPGPLRLPRAGIPIPVFVKNINKNKKEGKGLELLRAE